MSLPDVVSREEWLAARKELLVREKELTRAADAVNADRRRLPMVRVDKEYVFEGERGDATLRDLFGDSRQLLVYHAMFDPTWEHACPSCSHGMDESTPSLLAQLEGLDTRYLRISRAPYAKLAAERQARGWTFPWYSSFGSDFNYDFQVTVDPSVGQSEYNYRPMEASESTELPGFSCFLRDGDTVFHTYSSYARGTEPHGGLYRLLDLTALGRQEEWEEPKGRGL